MHKFRLIRLTILLAFATCTVTNASAGELKKRAYKKHSDSMGVVLVSVDWGRQWGCAGFENAQLLDLLFEHTNPPQGANRDDIQIKLKSPSRLFVDPVFLAHGFLVIPGTYAFTGWSVKAARSRSKVGTLEATRERLVEDDTYLGGTFSVGAGEVIYIGSFGLDCMVQPIPWRYFEHWGEPLDALFDLYKSAFKFLEGEQIQFRLLDTEIFGTDPYLWIIDNGNVALAEGDASRAIEIYSEALARAREAGENPPAAMAMYNLGRANGYACNREEAIEWFEKAIVAKKALPDEEGFWLSQNYLEFGRFYAAHEDWPNVVTYFELGLPLLDDSSMEVDDPLGYANTLETLNTAYRMTGRQEKADSLAKRIDALRAEHSLENARFAPAPYPSNCELIMESST